MSNARFLNREQDFLENIPAPVPEGSHTEEEVATARDYISNDLDIANEEAPVLEK